MNTNRQRRARGSIDPMRGFGMYIRDSGAEGPASYVHGHRASSGHGDELRATPRTETAVEGIVLMFIRAGAFAILADRWTNHFVRVAAYEVARGRNKWP